MNLNMSKKDLALQHIQRRSAFFTKNYFAIFINGSDCSNIKITNASILANNLRTFFIF